MSAITAACVLRAAWPEHGAKRAAAAAGMSPRTAAPWLTGRKSPSADTMLRMLRRSAELRAALIHELREAGHDDLAQAAACGLAPARRAADQPMGRPDGPAVTYGVCRRVGDRRRG